LPRGDAIDVIFVDEHAPIVEATPSCGVAVRGHDKDRKLNRGKLVTRS